MKLVQAILLTCLVFLTASCGVGLCVDTCVTGETSIDDPGPLLFNKASGLSGRVYSATLSGNNLIAVGLFTAFSTTRSGSIAVFSGNNYSAKSETSIGFDATAYNVTGPDTNGDVYVTGDFTSYAGVANRNAIVRLNQDGTLDAGFDIGTGASAGFDWGVYAVALTADLSGDVYVGGALSNYKGVPVNEIVRITNLGTLDATFITGTGFAGGQVLAIAPTKDGTGDVYVGGSFNLYNGATNINNIVRLDSNGTRDAVFNIGAGVTAGFDAQVEVITALADGDLYVGGNFNTYRGTANTNYIVRLNSDGSVDTAFNIGSGASAGLDGAPKAIVAAVDGSGDIYVGGAFTTYKGTSGYNNLVRLNSDGSVDAAFNCLNGFLASSAHAVSSITPAIDGSGDIYVAGAFTSYKGSGRARFMIRLNSDGSLDAGFNSLGGSGFDENVFDIQVNSDGLYVAGRFTSYQGVSSAGLVQLDLDGERDTRLNVGTGFSGGLFTTIYAIRPGPNGTLYVGGEFTTYNGTTGINSITRLNPDGSIDPTFVTGTGFLGGVVRGMALAADGSGDIYVAGTFTTYNGATNKNRIVRLNSDGTLDTGFNIGAGASAGFNNQAIDVVAAQDGSGDIYVGGLFTAYNSTTNINRIARLNSNGTLDTGFNIGAGATAGFNGSVFTLSLATDGSGDIYVGGAFTSYNNVADIRAVVRLNSDGSIDYGFDIGTGATAGFDAGGGVARLRDVGDGSGDLYVGGAQTSYKGVAIPCGLTRLKPDGSVNTILGTGSGAYAGINGSAAFVRAIAIRPELDGSLYMGGNFTSYRGTTHEGLARLSATGVSD